MFQLAQEFVQNQSAFFLDFAESEFLFQLTQKLLDQQDYLLELQQFQEQLVMHYAQTLQIEPQVFPPEMSKMYVPFKDNELGVMLLEKNPRKKMLYVYLHQLEKLPEEEELQVQQFLQALCELVSQQEVLKCLNVVGEDENGELEAEPYQTELIYLDKKTSEFFGNFSEESYFPYLMMVFNLLYERDQDELESPKILVNEETCRRLFYVLQTQAMAEDLLQGDENQQSVISIFEDIQAELQEKQQVKILDINVSQIVQGFQQKFQKDLQQFVKQLNASPQVQVIVGLIKLQLEEQLLEIDVYVYIRRNGPQKELGVYMLRTNLYEMYLQHLALELEKLKDVEVNLMLDFPRGYFLAEFSHIVLPMWSYYLSEMQFRVSPMDIIRFINYSMVPFYKITQMYEDQGQDQYIE